MEYSFYAINKLRKYQDKEIFLYPAGACSNLLLEGIKYTDIKIAGLIDKEKKCVKGYDTINAASVVEHIASVVFITSQVYEDELKNTLISAGYRGKIECLFSKKEKNESSNDLVLDRMDLVLTARCTLRCSKCANLMQYYENPRDVSLERICNSMKSLLSAIDKLKTIYVLGGEPFLYDDLGKVITELKRSVKIENIVIVTNGTICPSDVTLWETLCAENIKIHISNYGKLSRQMNSLFQKCADYGVNCEVEENTVFYDTGSMKKRNRTEEELNTVFTNCSTQCRSLFNGELHYCPRSSHGVDLGLIERREDDYVDLRVSGEGDSLRTRIKEFISRSSYVAACDYCDIRVDGYYEKAYPAAEQSKYILKV